VRLKSLSLNNFRSLSPISFSFEEPFTIISGVNGRGKTSVLESIYLISRLKSFRSKKLDELISFSSSNATINGIVEDEIGEQVLSLIVDKVLKPTLTLRLNDKAIPSSTSFLGKIPSVIFAPHHVDLIKGSALLRRELLDRHLVDISYSYGGTAISYHRALRSKGVLLRKARHESNSILKSFEPWNRIMAATGAKIRQHRHELLDKLLPHFKDLASYFTNDKESVLATLIPYGEEAYLVKEEELYNALERILPREIYAGRSLIGPHRDDLFIEFNGIRAREFASQGQARTLALSLTLSLAATIQKERESPIILLDDLDAELDEERLSKLFTFLNNGEFTQVIASTVNGERLSSLGTFKLVPLN
jgi:DNA replication and repair protein RecF